jgi:hypothetical protein
MKSFKISFYESTNGELIKLKELFRLCEAVADLVRNPPPEFFQMLETHFPINGWAEVGEDTGNVYVVFAPRDSVFQDSEKEAFRDWLDTITPSDFLK